MSFQTEIKDEKAFAEEVTNMVNVLQVLEIYSSWCGPCKAISAACRRLYFDHGEKGLKFYTVSSDALDLTKAIRGHCEPVFLFFRNGAELSDLRVDGVNLPVLTGNILSSLT